MTFLEFLSPLRRRCVFFIFLFLVVGGVLFGSFQLLPQTTKTTIYFTIKPLSATEKEIITINADREEKTAETIAGWAKDPGFREEILKRAEVNIPYFKQKLSARKQNRMNVFWTLTLAGAEQEYTAKVSESLIAVLQETLKKGNEKVEFPLEITEPHIFSEIQTIPISWVIPAIVVLSLLFAGLGIYLKESLGGRVSFLSQVEKIFPEMPLLRLSQKPGKHDTLLLEQFILTFQNPRLVGTFRVARKFFSLSPIDTIDEEHDTPILLVKLGETRLRELENLLAIYGDSMGIVVFER